MDRVSAYEGYGAATQLAGASEAILLDMFAPTRLDDSPKPVIQLTQTALWQADAIHRARNMAQLLLSIAAVAQHGDRGSLSPEAIQAARALSCLYEALGHDEPSAPVVPCMPILQEIVSRLIATFGRRQAIEVDFDLRPLSLPVDVRRALVLICSELVINVLKYGFPIERCGKVLVRLIEHCGQVCLSVADNGPGIAALYMPHEGGSLLDRLSTVLNAKITRLPGIGGSGYLVNVSFAYQAADE